MIKDLTNSKISKLFSPFFKKIELREEDIEKIRDLKGKIVYVLKHKNYIESLILREILERYGISPPSVSFGLPKTPLLLFTNPKHFFSKENEKVLDFYSIQSFIVHVDDDMDFERKIDTNKDPIYNITSISKDDQITFVPVLILYDSAPISERRLLGLLLKGENPGIFGAFVGLVFRPKKIVIKFGESIYFPHFEKDSKTKEERIYLLRKELLKRIDEEKRVIVGPLQRSLKEMEKMCLEDEDLEKTIEFVAKIKGKDKKVIYKEAKKYAKEMVGTFDPFWIKAMETLLSWIWENIFDGVVFSKDEIKRLKEAYKRGPLILIPSHKSHIDYLILSYVFYKNHLRVPFIAAGINLSFFPAGYIFKRTGAFFIRRNIQGKDRIYGKVLASYIKLLLKEGFPIEFYIEGGRSRTGKLNSPKYGLISILVQAFLEGTCDDLNFVPIYVGYDRVVEEKSYLHETRGGTKSKESFSSILKSRSILRKRYGKVYIKFCEPISLKEYIGNRNLLPKERRKVAKDIAYMVVRGINRVTVVTPISLVCSILLSTIHKALSLKDINFFGERFLRYLSFRGAFLSELFTQDQNPILSALDLCESWGFVSSIKEEEEESIEERIYVVEEEKRPQLEYYKNMIIHYFLPLSFVSTSLIKSENTDINTLKKDFETYKRIFSEEFIYDEDMDEWLHKTIAYLEREGCIKGDNSLFTLTVKGTKILPIYSSMICSYLEAYFVTLKGVEVVGDKKVERGELLKKLHRFGNKMLKKGEIARPESISTFYYNTGISLFTSFGILQEKFESGKNYILLRDKKACRDARIFIKKVLR